MADNGKSIAPMKYLHGFRNPFFVRYKIPIMELFVKAIPLFLIDINNAITITWIAYDIIQLNQKKRKWLPFSCLGLWLGV